MVSVLVTGASRGIGRAVASTLSGRGHRVIATARHAEDLDGLECDLALPLDVTDQQSVDSALEAAGEIDVLINNAGRTVRAPMELVPLDELRSLFELNTIGALRVSQAVLPTMRARGSGQILFVSSILGRLTIPLVGPYAASKWALEAVAETLAVEVARFGVEVVVLEPGPVASEVVQKANHYLESDGTYDRLVEQRSNARGATITVEEAADEIANVVGRKGVPFRVPIGRPAARALAARKSHSDAEAFRVPGLDW